MGTSVGMTGGDLAEDGRSLELAAWVGLARDTVGDTVD